MVGGCVRVAQASGLVLTKGVRLGGLVDFFAVQNTQSHKLIA